MIVFAIALVVGGAVALVELSMLRYSSVRIVVVRANVVLVLTVIYTCIMCAHSIGFANEVISLARWVMVVLTYVCVCVSLRVPDKLCGLLLAGDEC